jgi:hypothetical protein
MSRFSMRRRVCGRSEAGALRLASRGPEPTSDPVTLVAVTSNVTARPDPIRNAVRPWLIPGGTGSPLGGPREPCVTMGAGTCTLEVRNVGNGLAFIEPDKCYLLGASGPIPASRVARRAVPVNEEASIDFALAAAPDDPARGVEVEVYYTDVRHTQDVSARFAIVRTAATGDWTVSDVVYRHPNADDPFGTIHFSR